MTTSPSKILLDLLGCIIIQEGKAVIFNHLLQYPGMVQITTTIRLEHRAREYTWLAAFHVYVSILFSIFGGKDAQIS